MQPTRTACRPSCAIIASRFARLSRRSVRRPGYRARRSPRTGAQRSNVLRQVTASDSGSTSSHVEGKECDNRRYDDDPECDIKCANVHFECLVARALILLSKELRTLTIALSNGREWPKSAGDSRREPVFLAGPPDSSLHRTLSRSLLGRCASHPACGSTPVS
jgi:hypothetical protein